MPFERRNERPVQDLMPIGLGQNRGDDVGYINQRSGNKDALDDLVVEAQDEEEDHDERDRHGDVARDSENLGCRSDAGKLGRRDQRIDQEEHEHREHRDAYAEVLAHERSEALSRDRTHTHRHLLHHDQRHRERHEHPDDAVAELRARL